MYKQKGWGCVVLYEDRGDNPSLPSSQPNPPQPGILQLRCYILNLRMYIYIHIPILKLYLRDWGHPSKKEGCTESEFIDLK